MRRMISQSGKTLKKAVKITAFSRKVAAFGVALAATSQKKGADE